MKKKSLFMSLVMILGIGFGVIPGSSAEQKQQSKPAASKEQPKQGGTLIFGLGKEFANPNPFIQTSSTFQFVKEACYESLLTSNDEGNVVPALAEAYDVSPGGTVVTLRLRKGVKFHNGKEMKADDVVWSANHVKNPKNGAFGNNMITDVKAVEKIDDYTVRVTLHKPSVTILAYLSNIQMLPIVPANSLQTGQIKLDKNIFVPGTGAFIFEQYQPGFDTVVKRFPDYWGGPAYLDKIIFRPITDNANRFNALRTGDVQMADRLSPLDAARVKKGDIKGIKILDEPLGGYSHLMFNYGNPLFQKLEMRQAVLAATDKQRLIDEVFFGHATKADLEIDPKGIWAKAANLPAHKRDLAKAKTLLRTAGYNGQELVWIGRKQEADFLESCQRMLGEAGIKVKIDILESGVMKERFREGKFDLYVGGATIFDEPVITMVPDYYSNKVLKGSYSNPKVDQLIDSLSAEFDQKKRLTIFRELAWTLHNDVADIPLLFEVRYVGMMENVNGYGPAAGYSYSESGDYFKHVWLK
jgi:ABC-type transport system substrate-binding protein